MADSEPQPAVWDECAHLDDVPLWEDVCVDVGCASTCKVTDCLSLPHHQALNTIMMMMLV